MKDTTSLGLEFATFVFFAEHLSFDRNFLGRTGWLDPLRIAIADYDRTPFLAPYDSYRREFIPAVFLFAAPAARSWR